MAFGFKTYLVPIKVLLSSQIDRDQIREDLLMEEEVIHPNI